MSAFFVRVDRAERRICLLANAACRRRLIRNTFRICSRLGDGVFWYALMAAMPLIVWASGRTIAQGLWISLEMLAAGATNLWLDEKIFALDDTAGAVQAFAGRLHEAVEVL